MGSWGAEVYQSDSALDLIDDYKHRLEQYIVFFLAPPDLSGLDGDNSMIAVAAIDIMASLCERANTVSAISLKIIRHWREMCLARFEADTSWDDTVTPEGLDGRTERRKVIEATFDRLETFAMD